MLHITERGKYQNFTVNHKLHVNDLSAKKADTAKKMLAAYDSLAGGKLSKAVRSGRDIDDSTLAKCLCGVELVATFDVWETDDKQKSGNWVRGIGPKPKKLRDEDSHIQKQAEAQREREPGDDDEDLDIVF
jgi:hypothetical protein